MFTGLIQALAILRISSDQATSASIKSDTVGGRASWLNGCSIFIELAGTWISGDAPIEKSLDGQMFWSTTRVGDSIAVDGVCLTVHSIDTNRVEFRLSAETLNCTQLSKKSGKVVNLEKALVWGDAVGGHIVSGHIEAMGLLDHFNEQPTEKTSQQDYPYELDLWFQLSIEKVSALRFKDSVTIDGVSLTIAEIDTAKGQFRVSLISQTLMRTTLRLLKPGDSVNIEFNNHALKPAVRSDTSASTSASSASAALSPLSSDVVDKCDDAFFMRAALMEAEKGRTSTPPNPWVGCVFVHNGVIISHGYHVKAGEPHAEVIALNHAISLGITHQILRECTVYITLEPCHKFGRQPPCDRELIKVGIKRVVIALLDPDERTNGLGVVSLRKAGIDVTIGVLEVEVRASLRAYLHQRATGRPFVISKLATTLDGRYCLKSGSPVRWITNEASRRHVHKIRAESQAIMIGSQTILTDNPRLDSRSGINGNEMSHVSKALRVVIDSRGVVIDQSLSILDISISPTIVFTTQIASADTLAIWMKCGVKVVVQQSTNGHVNLKEVLSYLASKHGVIQVLVEGGAALHDALINDGLVDQFHLYTSSGVLGRKGRVWGQQIQLPSVDSVTNNNGLGMSYAMVEWKPLETFKFGNTDILRIFDIEPKNKKTTILLETKPLFSDIQAALTRFARGGFIIVMDAEDRENEGDLMCRADLITQEQLAFMRYYTSGIICASMLPDRAASLDLHHLIGSSNDPFRTPFAMSVDATTSTTGVSAKDRLATARALCDPSATPKSLRRPGHFFARPGLLNERQGHTEAGVTLCQLVGMTPPVCVLSELTNEDGSMMQYTQSATFAREFDLPIITIQQIADEVKQLQQRVFLSHSLHSKVPTLDVSTGTISSNPLTIANNHQLLPMPVTLAHCRLHLLGSENMEFGTFTSMYGVASTSATPTRVLTCGLNLFSPRSGGGGVKPPTGSSSRILVRIHSDCFTGDVLGSLLCDCGEQLRRSIDLISSNPSGGLIIFPQGQEGRGIGLTNKIRAYQIMQQSNSQIDTYKANTILGFGEDERDYKEAAVLLASFGLGSIDTKLTLLTTNPDKLRALRNAGIEYVDAIALDCQPSPHNKQYLQAKSLKHSKLSESSKNKTIKNSLHQSQAANPSVSASSNSNSTSMAGQGSSIPVVDRNNLFTTTDNSQPHHGTFNFPLSTSIPPHVLSQRICVVQASWHRHLSNEFLRQLKIEMVAIGLSLPIDVYETGGCFEIPYVLNELISREHESGSSSDVTSRGKYAAYLALGALVKGESMHFEYISASVIPALMELQLKHRVPVINGVINCLDEGQMRNRFEGRTNMPKSIAGTILDAITVRKVSRTL